MSEIVQLDEKLDANSVAAHRDRWLVALDESVSELRVNIGNLTHVDTAGLQLLIALKKEAAKRETTVSLTGNTRILRDRTDLLGLQTLLS